MGTCLFWLRLSIVCWDPGMNRSMRIPVCDLPYHIASYDAKYVLKVMDAFMAEASSCVKALICDAHKSHCSLKRIMFGVATEQDKETVSELNLKWLPQLEFRDLPESCVPRLPVKIAHIHDEVYHMIPGACALEDGLCTKKVLVYNV